MEEENYNNKHTFKLVPVFQNSNTRLFEYVKGRRKKAEKSS